MKKIDRNILTGIILLTILPILFVIFLKVASNNLDNGEGMALLAFMLFYAIFHGLATLALLLYAFFKYKKLEAIKRKKSILFLISIILVGFIPLLIVFF